MSGFRGKVDLYEISYCNGSHISHEQIYALRKGIEFYI